MNVPSYRANLARPACPPESALGLTKMGRTTGVLFEKAGALHCSSMVKNHPFVDGNKRLGL